MRRSRPSPGDRRAPRRTCVGCRAVRAQASLIRIAADGAGGVLVGRGAGRGAYCCPEASCLERALQRKALPRALRSELRQLDPEALRRAFAAAADRLQPGSTGSH